MLGILFYMRCNGINKYNQIQGSYIHEIQKYIIKQKRGTLQHGGDVPLLYILIIYFMGCDCYNI